MSKDEINWDKIIEQDFAALRGTLRNLETEVKKKPGLEAYHWLQPIKDLLFEATMEVMQDRNNRLKDGENILRQLNEYRLKPEDLGSNKVD